MTTVGVSIVLTDLVGSTDLATRVGAETADRLRREHFGLLRDAIAAHGGREVKNLGDGVMAVFPGVAGAADAAVAIQQVFARRNADAEEPLLIRIGVSSGDCTEEDDDFFGEPVVQAARLCAQAEGGRILAADVVRLLAPRGRHEFVRLGERELKGLPEPVAVVEIVVPAAAGAVDPDVPLPARLQSRGGLAFVGRAAERGQLDAARRAVAAGARRIVLVSGEAGLGKTRLVSACAADAREAGAIVAYGRCDEEIGRQYGPWAEAIAHLAAHLPAELLAGLDVRSLARLAPGLASAAAVEAGPADVDGEEFVLFAAVTDFLAKVARAAPLVIVLDDLHWADRGTLLLLRHVAAATLSDRLLILATFRDTDSDPDGPLAATVAALHREEGVVRLALDGLSEGDVAELVTTAAGHSLDADGSALVRTLRTETGGNPFFLGEMLRHLAESGAIARGEDGRWSVGTGLTAAGMPQSVREVVLARVRRLGEAATRVLTVAAVCGREFALGTVASAAGEDEDAVLDALEAATAAGLVAAVDGTIERFGFAHALVQHTLADELSPARRARTHRAIADAIEAAGPGGVGGRAAELATHLFAAGRPEDGARAITYAIRAGDEAVAALAPTDAAAWFRRALDAMPAEADRAERCALEIRLGEAERRSDDVAFLPRLLAAAAEARELGRGDLLIAAALARYRGYQLSGADVDPDQVALIEDALAAAGDADSPDRARLLAASAAELRFGGDPAYVERSRESIAVARRTGDTETLIDTLAWSSFDTPATFGERRRVAEEVLRLTERLDDPLRRFWTLVQAMTTWLTNGDIHSARRGAAEMTAVANRLGSPQNRWIASMWGVQLLVIGGELAEAERASEAAFAIGLDAGRHDTMLYFGSHLMAIRFQQGRSAEVVPLIEQAIIEYPRVPGFRSVHAYALAEVGDLAGARERFSALAREGFAFPEDQVWMAATVLAAETAHHLGDREAAAILLERLVPYTDRIALQSVTASLGAVSHYVGLLYATLGEAERAEAHLLDAVDRNTRFETPYYRARTMLALARLVRDRDPVRSESLVADAVAVADRYGFAGLGTAAAAVASEG